MKSLHESRSMKIISPILILCFLGFQATCLLPQEAHASATDDLKRIEYKYYFRGNYEKAIEEFRAFLKRKDLTPTVVVEAVEYLAASLILSGASEQGKNQYMQLLKMDSSYEGPDPSVFKPIIIATYQEAKNEYASMVIRSVPDKATPSAEPMPASVVKEEGKPIYKKWWFYATVGAVLLVAAGAAGSGGGDDAPPRETGTVTVDVGIQ